MKGKDKTQWGQIMAKKLAMHKTMPIPCIANSSFPCSILKTQVIPVLELTVEFISK